MKINRFLRLVSFSFEILKSHLLKIKPYKLNFVITKECHSRCGHCSIWQEKEYNDLSLKQIEIFFKANPHFRWVDLTGGEPTDHPDFVEIIKIISKHSPKLYFLHFPTNGLNTKKIARVTREILDLNLPIKLVVTVSIDGPQKINDELRGVPGDFVHSLESYKALSALPDVEVYVGMTLFPKNLKHIDETVNEIKSLVPNFSYEQMHINLGHSSEHYYNNDDISIGDEVLAEIKAFRQKRMNKLKVFALVETIFLRKLLEYIKTGATPVPCSALKNSVYLSENGTLYPCSIWNKPMGSIKEEPCLDTHLAKNHNLLTQIKSKQCPNCWTPCEAYPSLGSKLIPELTKELFNVD